MLPTIRKSGSTVTASCARILLIDRKSSQMNSIKELLSAQGTYEVIATCSLAIIREIVRHQKADMVFLGYTQDSKSKEIASILKKENTLPVIGIVNSRQECSTLGIQCRRYIDRSTINSSLLARTIPEILEQKKTALKLEQRVQELHSREAQFLNVLLSTDDGIVIIGKENTVLFENPAARNMLGSKTLDTIFLKAITVGAVREIRVGGGGKGISILEARASATTWDNNPAVLLSLRDITARKAAEESLRKSEERYALAVRGSKDGLWDWNLVHGKVFFCDQWKAILGYQNDELGNSVDVWFSRIHASDVKRVQKRLQKHLDGALAHFESEHRVHHKNGGCRWVLVRGSAVRNRKGIAVRIAGSMTDITERKKAERQLRKALEDLRFALASEKVLMEELDRKNKELVELSITDGLTGLYNHRFLQERFDFEFKRVRRYGGALSCMIIDIDHFKNVNDTYGHQFGDLVLRQIATIMKTKSREVDICGRYGGEEFMILANLNAADTLKFATKLHTAIENHLFENGLHSIHITVSIGIAEYHNQIKSKQMMIEQADTALYQAKKDGRNLIRIWKEIERQDDASVDRCGIQELKDKFFDLSRQMRSMYMESINALIKAVDAKDPFAKEHSKHVSEYSVGIARMLGLSDGDIEVIRFAALLHDVGKISIKDEILVKKEKLSKREFEILKRHPEVGVNILKDLRFLEKEIPMILHHHERFDGSGYPHGLSGREIPLGARIIAVADAFDAMVSGRTYKKKVPFQIAVREIHRGNGTQFAPEIVDVFIKMAEQGLIGRNV